MEAAVKTTAGSRRRKGHGRDRPRQPSLVGGEYLESSSFTQQMPSDNPTVDELRRVRAEFYGKTPEDRRRETEKDMNPHATQGRHSRSRKSSLKITESSIRDLRRDHESKHKHRREKNKEEPEDDTVYVYKQVYDIPKDADRAKPMPRRRASAPRTTTRYDGEGVRTQEPSITRRHTERRAVGRKEAGAELNRSRRRSDSEAAVPNSLMSRSASLREKSSRLDSRPPLLARSHTTVHKAQQSLPAQPSRQPHLPLSMSKDKTERKALHAKRVERPTSIFGALFGMQKSQEAKKERLVNCLTCLSDDIPVSQSAKLVCKHRMCHECLHRIFTLSVTDPQHMPPKCCTDAPIPLKHVEAMFDTRFKIKWNQKYQEYTTKNRVYCTAKGCGEWIKPAQIHLDTSGGANTGRKYGICGKCKTKVCCTCNGKWHISRECPKDEATKQFAEIAKKEGWKKCYNCSAMVELNDGCNHMTCRCRAQFCMSCGLKWKTCDCPWFTYQAVENDRLLHLNGGGGPPAGFRGFPGHLAGGRPDGRPMPWLRHPEEGQERQNMRPDGRPDPLPRHPEERHHQGRHEQGGWDEFFARRMQMRMWGLDIADDNNETHPRPRGQPFASHNEDFAHRAPDMISGAAMHAMATARNRPNERLRNNINPPAPTPHRDFVNGVRRVMEEMPEALTDAVSRMEQQQQHPPRRPPYPRASGQRNNKTSTQSSERVVPRRAVANYELEAQIHQPNVVAPAAPAVAGALGATGAPGAAGAAGESGGEAAGSARPGRRHSAMAGLTRGSGEGRVDEWRRHIGEE